LTRSGHQLRSYFLLLAIGSLPMIPILNARQRDLPGTPTSTSAQAPAIPPPPLLVPVEIIVSGADPLSVLIEVPVVAIPEPSLPILLTTGAAWIFLRRRRADRRK